ncbi:arylsulfatase [Pseudoteredinibacter isoporae]|uniref:arylsulfatase n=1 Tax=Pseudoteredinibacter isoporae TaxID=570281 RepID=UPI00334037F0
MNKKIISSDIKLSWQKSDAMAGLFVRILMAFLTLGICSHAQADSPRPNVLLVVADDLGFADLGYLGSEINTPNIDRLAAQGVQFTDFHTAFTCSPTRAMLLTGVDSHLAGLGNMAEELADNQRGKPGYEGYLNQRVESLATILKSAGYNTYMAGKWHLGKGEGQGPESHGFDRSFALLSGGASHYADMKPAYAQYKEQKAGYREDGVLLTTLPDNFQYSSQFYVDQLLGYIQSGKQEKPQHPFFAYLAFTAPHWPLQASEQAIAEYRGKYDQGYEQLHKERFAKQRALGLVTGEPAAMPAGSRQWASLSSDAKSKSIRAMEIYAAMVTEMDKHLGRLLARLERQGELDNTLVIFLSDNGAEGHDVDATWPKDQFPKVYNWVMNNHDFSLEAMGKVDSYVFYGPEWAWAGAPGFYGYKGFSSEGGSHVPAFLSYPKAIEAGRVDELVRVKDMVPTILDIVGVRAAADKKPSADKAAVHPISGRSILPALQGKPMAPVNFISELFGKRVVRSGDWKATHMPSPMGNGQWRLYNIRNDRAEQQDLALKNPDKLKQLITLWDDYARRNNVILPNWVSGY